MKWCTSDWDLNPRGQDSNLAKTLIGTWAHEAGTRTCQNSDWDSNPHGWDSNPAKTLIETWTHMAGTWTRPKPAVFQLRSCTWFQDLMKLMFLMSQRRKNSVRDKVIGKKWIYLERNTLHRQSGAISEGEKSTRVWGCQFLKGWVISYANEWEEYSSYFWKGQGFPGIGPPPTFWSLWSALELSWHLWVCHLACWCVTVSAHWGSGSSGSWLVHHLGPFGSNQFMSCPQAMSFFQRLGTAPFPPVSKTPWHFPL